MDRQQAEEITAKAIEALWRPTKVTSPAAKLPSGKPKMTGVDKIVKGLGRYKAPQKRAEYLNKYLKYHGMPTITPKISKIGAPTFKRTTQSPEDKAFQGVVDHIAKHYPEQKTLLKQNKLTASLIKAALKVLD
jgi:hypothetical protein